MLNREVTRGEDLRQQLFEKILPQPAPQLGRAENLLERGDISADFVNFAIGFLEPAEALLHIANDAGGVIESLAQALLGLL